MKTRHIIAAGLMILAFLIHVIAGELTDIRALISTSMANVFKLEIRVVWHLVSIDFLISGAFLIIIHFKNSIDKNELLIDFIGLRMLLYGFLFFIMIIFTDVSLLFQAPQWILLICIGLLLEWKYFTKLKKHQQK